MEETHAANDQRGPVRIRNRTGKSPFVVLCDHASRHIPTQYGTLGLSAGERISHIAWDPGALPVASGLAASLDAALVESCVSRLVADCNRPLDVPDLVPEVSERTAIPGNRSLGPDERARRIAMVHAPYHACIESLVGERLAAGREIFLVALHSFTPVYKGASRPWQIGVIHDQDMCLAGPILDALKAVNGVTVGDNQPYSPADRVYYTLERHGRSRGLPCVMIEIRNDEIGNESGQREWADLLARILLAVKPKSGASTLAGSVRGAGEEAGCGK